MRAAKRDATERGIVEGLRRCGYRVMLLDKFDALVYGNGGRYAMMDFKSPGGRPTASQEKLVSDGWPLHFVETLEQALSIMKPTDPVDGYRKSGAM